MAAHPWGPRSPEPQTPNPATEYWIPCLKKIKKYRVCNTAVCRIAAMPKFLKYNYLGTYATSSNSAHYTVFHNSKSHNIKPDSCFVHEAFVIIIVRAIIIIIFPHLVKKKNTSDPCHSRPHLRPMPFRGIHRGLGGMQKRICCRAGATPVHPLSILRKRVAAHLLEAGRHRLLHPPGALA